MNDIVLLLREDDLDAPTAGYLAASYCSGRMVRWDGRNWIVRACERGSGTAARPTFRLERHVVEPLGA